MHQIPKPPVCERKARVWGKRHSLESLLKKRKAYTGVREGCLAADTTNCQQLLVKPARRLDGRTPILV
jgi:hypothetical protein